MVGKIQIDLVSDISCPWCVIGLRELERALAETADVVKAQITFQPFELNPQMAPEGQNIGEHVAEKYGSTPNNPPPPARSSATGPQRWASP